VHIARCPGQLTFAVPELTCSVDIKLKAQVLLQLEPSSFTHLPLPLEIRNVEDGYQDFNIRLPLLVSAFH
jgi:hypothetical protein